MKDNNGRIKCLDLVTLNKRENKATKTVVLAASRKQNCGTKGLDLATIDKNNRTSQNRNEESEGSKGRTNTRGGWEGEWVDLVRASSPRRDRKRSQQGPFNLIEIEAIRSSQSQSGFRWDCCRYLQLETSLDLISVSWKSLASPRHFQLSASSLRLETILGSASVSCPRNHAAPDCLQLSVSLNRAERVLGRTSVS